MSSIRDIIHVEGVEPLPSRTITTSQQEQSSQSLSQLPKQDTRFNDTRYQAQPLRLPPLECLSIPSPLSPQPSSSSLSRKRSGRSPKTSDISAFGPLSGSTTALGSGPNPPNSSSSPGRRPSVGTEYMDSRFCQERSISPSAGYSSSYSDSMARGVGRRGKEASEIAVRYTPVTGRISKAQKGLPVHKCQLCDRKPFSRAEHLRRHMTTHGPPTHLCKVPGCDKAFHRKDLLERHMERHNDTQTSPQSRDNERRSRSSSHEFKAPQARTPRQQKTISMGGGASSYATRNAPTPIPASPIDANMNMMGRYTPEPHRCNASSFNQQSYQQAQKYPIGQLASPITTIVDVPSTYAQISSIASCAGSSPMAAYVTMSSSIPATYSTMMPTYTSNSGSFQHNYIPVSEGIKTFDPQAHMPHEISQRLINRNDLSVDVPYSGPGSAHTNSPLYHSDRDSNSTWSTPSDPNKSHVLITGPYPQHTPLGRAFSPASYPPQPPMLSYNEETRQQQLRNIGVGYGLGFPNEAVWDDDRVSITATHGTGHTDSDADWEQYQSETEQAQLQYEGAGGQEQGYMEDNYEQNWQAQVQIQGRWPM